VRIMECGWCQLVAMMKSKIRLISVEEVPIVSMRCGPRRRLLLAMVI
jgi:hypothetical protein